MAEVLSDRTKGVDMVNHPPHYASIVPGVECIEIAREFPFNCGNAIKYIWRAGAKGEGGMDARQKEIEDLKKARFYLDNELGRKGSLWTEKYGQKFGYVACFHEALVMEHFTGNRRAALEAMIKITSTHSKGRVTWIYNQIKLARDAVQAEINRLEQV